MCRLLMTLTILFILSHQPALIQRLLIELHPYCTRTSCQLVPRNRLDQPHCTCTWLHQLPQAFACESPSERSAVSWALCCHKTVLFGAAFSSKPQSAVMAFHGAQVCWLHGPCSYEFHRISYTRKGLLSFVETRLSKTGQAGFPHKGRHQSHISQRTFDIKFLSRGMPFLCQRGHPKQPLPWGWKIGQTN